MKKNKILIIYFQNNISFRDIQLFRGAIVKILDAGNNLLFHNHTEDNFRYSYPLIQYKCINQKATIVCMNEGTNAIGNFFASCDFDISIGTRKETLKTENIQAIKYELEITECLQTYVLRKWLPLNNENYQAYCQIESFEERTHFLERMLVGNILSFAKGMGVFFSDKITCNILVTKEPFLITYKHVKLMCFDVEFETNVTLPDYIGLGKGVSMGYGIITRKYKNQ